MRNTIIFLAILLLVSCKSTKEFTKTDTIKKDSLVVKELVHVSMPASVDFAIDKPCDSLGNLIPFTQQVRTEYVNVYVKGEDNIISTEIDIDSIKSVFRAELQKEFESNKTDVLEVVTERYIPTWVWYLLVYAIVGTLYVFKKPIFRLIKTFI